MPQLIHLPGELLARAISHVDRSALKQLRQTCRTLSQFASRELFRAVRLFPDEESYERVRNISNNAVLRRVVRKIYINTCDKDSEWGDPDCTLTEPFKDAIMQLKHCPNVQSAVLRFDKNCCVDDDGVPMWRSEWPQPPTYREEVLRVFFSWLTSLDVPIKELGIRNLQGRNIKDAEVRAMMAKVLCSLQSLRLNIATEHHEASPEEDLEFPEPHEFFAEMPSSWLKPTMASLEHLTLYCDNYWGFFPKVDLGGIHFPRLKTLALGNFGFVQDSQVEWIISHGATLTELYLDDCTILYDVGITNENIERCSFEKTQMEVRIRKDCPQLSQHCRSYEKRWHDLFDAFRTGLTFLRHFRMGTTCWSEGMPFEKEIKINIGLMNDRYMACYDGYGPSPYITCHHTYQDYEKAPPECDEEDRNALRLLLKSLSQGAPDSWSVGYREVEDLLDTDYR
ncbi:F-box domain protein [Aspergillus arachidicola]|uniref:F-box domain protein n=1 Tax=Aspergillus arachidicola TaxID=656916 RepID=A0A2G7G0X6_9EURO|nr:F-box domain protein [Aspergillus arachidicola]